MRMGGAVDHNIHALEPLVHAIEVAAIATDVRKANMRLILDIAAENVMAFIAQGGEKILTYEASDPGDEDFHVNVTLLGQCAKVRSHPYQNTADSHISHSLTVCKGLLLIARRRLGRIRC